MNENGNANGFYMPVAPASYGAGNNGFMDGNGWWIILLFLLCGNGMWGGFGGMGGMNAYGNAMLGYDFPWIMNGQQGINANVNGGFRDAQLSNAVSGIQNGITSGFGDVQNSLCAGFAGVNASVTNAQNALAQQMYGNTIADLERSFAAQTASTQGMTAIQSQLAQCCCDNRLATAQTQSLVQSENCADRAALSDGIRDILTATQNQTQQILNQLNSDKLDAKNDEIAQLRQQLSAANLAASQTAQTARILAGQTAEVDALYDRLNNCPVGTVPVYGRQPIFTAPANGCGCAFAG